MKSGTSEVTGTSNVSLFMMVPVIYCYYVSEHRTSESHSGDYNDKLVIEVFFIGGWKGGGSGVCFF